MLSDTNDDLFASAVSLGDAAFHYFPTNWKDYKDEVERDFEKNTLMGPVRGTESEKRHKVAVTLMASKKSAGESLSRLKKAIEKEDLDLIGCRENGGGHYEKIADHALADPGAKINFHKSLWAASGLKLVNVRVCSQNKTRVFLEKFGAPHAEAMLNYTNESFFADAISLGDAASHYFPLNWKDFKSEVKQRFKEMTSKDPSFDSVVRMAKERAKNESWERLIKAITIEDLNLIGCLENGEGLYEQIAGHALSDPGLQIDVKKSYLAASGLKFVNVRVCPQNKTGNLLDKFSVPQVEAPPTPKLSVAIYDALSGVSDPLLYFKPHGKKIKWARAFHEEHPNWEVGSVERELRHFLKNLKETESHPG